MPELPQGDDTGCRAESVPPQMFLDAIRVLTGKWKVDLLWTLVQGTHRFGELRRALPGITQHMLTTQLRELEADGLIKRTAYAEIPPRVEYEVTDAAYALRPMFRELIAWSRVYGPLAHMRQPERDLSLPLDPKTPAQS